MWRVRFASPPADWRSYVDAVAVTVATVPTWHVVVPMWTDEGRSDLSVELVVVILDGVVAIEIDDLHAL